MYTAMAFRLLIFILGIFAAWNGVRSKTYCRYWLTCATLLLGGSLSLFIGEHYTTVDQEGFVHEAGLCLPTGAIMVCIGAIGIFILGILYSVQKLKK